MGALAVGAAGLAVPRWRVVFAHQGGWDELLLVAAPIGLFALLLVLANRRAQKQLDREHATEETEADTDSA
ncbi:MAG: hypothetical protein ABIV94_10990 [Acidimicrobiales bacterium]